MRVDKFLWCVRFYKSRSLATAACKKGVVRIGGVIAKPSREVYISDALTIRKQQLDHQVEVLDLPKSRVSAKIIHQYYKNTTPLEILEARAEIERQQSLSRPTGEGRPTKKDRRDLTDFFEQDSHSPKDSLP